MKLRFNHFIVFLMFAIAGGENFAFGDKVQYQNHGELALSQLFENIRNSKPGETIDMSYYIWSECHAATKVLVNELAKKAKQGVKVRIMIDGYNQSAETKVAYTEFMRRKGIQLRYINDVTPLNPGYQMRSHIKMSVFNGKAFQTGGRNIADDYYGLMSWGTNWVDRDVYVQGDSAKEAQAGFDRIWNRKSTKLRSGGGDAEVKSLEKSCGGWWGKDEEKLRKHLMKNARRTIAKHKVYDCRDTSVAVDDYNFLDSTTDDGSEYMSEERMLKKPATKAVYDLVGGANKSLLLENYSYIPTRKLSGLISADRKKGSEIRVVSNDFKDSAEPVGSRARHYLERDNLKGKQVNLGLSTMGKLSESWDLTPKGAKFMIHSKVFVANKKDTVVSSFNVDGRSEHYSLEAAVTVRNCPAFAKEVTDSTDLLAKVWLDDAKKGLCDREAPESGLEPLFTIIEDFL